MTNEALLPPAGDWPGFMLPPACPAPPRPLADEAACIAAAAATVPEADCRGNGVIDMLGCCDFDDFCEPGD